MYIYHIILEFDLPLDTLKFRTAPALEVREAIWMVDSFPFEEPSYFEQFPDEGPPPHILFVNLKSDCFLLVTYEGDDHFSLTCGEDMGKHQIMSELEKQDLKEALTLFWSQDYSFKELCKELRKSTKKYTLL